MDEFKNDEINKNNSFDNENIDKIKEKKEELKQALMDVLGSDAKIKIVEEEPAKINITDGATKVGFNCKLVVDGVEITASFTINKKAILPLFNLKNLELSGVLKKQVNDFFSLLKNTTETHLKNM